jgi:hypothetical protein
MVLGHGPNKTFMVPESFGATDGTIENDQFALATKQARKVSLWRAFLACLVASAN